MNKKKIDKDLQILTVNENHVLTIEFLCGNKIFEHQIARADRFVYPECSMHWNNWPSKYLNKWQNVPSKKELKEIVMKGGLK